MSDDEHRLIAERRRKLGELRERGQAFPNDVERDALAGELQTEFADADKEAVERAGRRVRVLGRLMAKRVMGKASFAVLQDGSGRIQLRLERDLLPEGVYRDFKRWDVGDIVAAAGGLFRTDTGELTVRATALRLVVKSLRPLPEKFHGLTDQELRYRRRYVDLIVTAKSRETFRVRSQMVQYIRRFLDARDFLEVETPMMQPIPGGALARPFVTHHNALDLDLYLRIAPELYLKRLLVGGLERVYEINRNFRNEGLSTQHNPEFTMMELYQAYADCQAMMALTEELVRGMAREVLGTTVLRWQEGDYDLGAPFARLPIEQALLDHNPGLEAARIRDVEYLREQCAARSMTIEPAWGAGKLQIELFEKTVEETLDQPTFVTAFPAEVSPLARLNDDDPFITDRFELFIGGREIANGFSELNDPEDQAERFRRQAEARSGGDDEAMYFDADYVRALEYGMPPAGGLGIGVDRLVMLFTDSASIRDVLLFPLMRPEA